MKTKILSRVRRFVLDISSHRYGLSLLAYLLAAFLTGMACVLFMWSFEFVLKYRLDFSRVGAWAWVATPILFLISVEFIKRVAPAASGTGIPQAIFAAKHLHHSTESKLWPLLSPTTLVVKILALLIGVWAGASTGREGPTVHVAACVFFGLLIILRRWTKFNFDPRSAVVAGGAAGLAAAFNTPLAGVTFAVEELTVDYFSGIKDFVLMAIVIAGLSAKILTGEYAYFGKLIDTPDAPILSTLLIGLIGGLLGAFFSTAILKGQSLMSNMNGKYSRYLTPLALALALLVLTKIFGTRILGPGNEVAQTLLGGSFGSWVIFFPFAKILATLFTYWSGIAGGIFAPCLSIGAALGAAVGSGMNLSIATCALIGMAAFLSGTIQAPITSFVIIFEMTGHHQMLLPIMLGSLLGFMTARLVGAKHLYQALAENYQYLFSSADDSRHTKNPD